MTNSRDDAWLLTLGALVSDGRDVDWENAAAQSADPEQQRLVEQLRRIAAIVDAHRTVSASAPDRGPEAGAEPAPPPTQWRHLLLFERIGSGAFGSVHRGWDPLLDREVAVKLLSRIPTGHASPLDEARHLARVRHPNVVMVHGADEDGQQAGIWMEYIDGLTLAEIVHERGPMSPREVTGIGADLCSALSAIHAAGLVHRDVKAQNVMREVGGRIVLMDFSGAHAVRGDAGPAVLSGTPLYMAPELFAGAAPCPATDVYSLGVLLFFLLTARLPVDAATAADVRQAHANGERRRLRDARADVPDGLVHVVERATAADPAERFRTAGELEHALAAAAGSATVVVPAGDTGRRRRPRPAWPAVAALLAAGVLAAVAAMAAVERWTSAPAARPNIVRFTIGPPYLSGSWPRISPDGRFVVFGAYVEGRNRLWIRPLDRPGGGYALMPTTASETPFWSPDSSAVAFFEDGMLKRIPVEGGAPQVLTEAPRPRGGDWTGNTILYARQDGIYRIDARGGKPERLTVVNAAAGEDQHGWPEFLPDGRRFLYVVRNSQRERGGVYVGSLDGDAPWRLLPAYSRTKYEGGHLFYVRGGALLAQPFDARTASLRGEALTLVERVQAHSASDAAFDLSSGVLIYSVHSSRPSTRLVLFDRHGRELQALTDVAYFRRPRFAPDGARVVAERVDTEADNSDLWLFGVARTSAVKLTQDHRHDVSPVWSPDGRRVAFSSNRGSVYDIYVKTVDTVEDDQLLFSSPSSKFVESWSPDGRYLVSSVLRSGMWLVPLDGSAEPRLIRADGTALTWHAEFSPDGRWLAYMSTASGTTEVYVEPFPLTGDRWQVSTKGGAEPHWLGDSRELLYLDADGVVMSVTLEGSGWKPSAPQPLFRVAVPDIAGATDYAVSPDGRHLVVNSLVADPLVPPLDVVLNWPALLDP